MDINSHDTVLQLMSATALRARVLANNVANLNTPGYRRQDVQFEEQLLEQLRKSHKGNPSVAPRIVVDHEATLRPNGNSVSLEHELTLSRENRAMFEVWAALLQGRMAMMSSAINGPR